MKTDSIFYLIFQIYPQFFLELLNLSPEESQRYRFDSIANRWLLLQQT